VKVRFHARAWPIPRPYLFGGWELDTIWFGAALGNRYSDDILQVEITHVLSDRQLRVLMRIFG
jgi:hypothetical protein